MSHRSDEESALKKLKAYNKALAILLPVLIVMGIAFIIFYQQKLNIKLTAYSDQTGSLSTPPAGGSQSQVEVLPQIIRASDDSSITPSNDPFQAPMKLTGIVYYSERSTAIIEAGGVFYIAGRDESIGNGPWKVEAIDKYSVSIAYDGKTEKLTLTEASTTDDNQADKKNNLSMNIKNADIRDVLSAYGKATGKNIIFSGQPVQVSYSIQNAGETESLQYLLKTMGLDFVENGSTIIVGTRDTLTNDFFNSIALTRFPLKYLSSDVISSQIASLGIKVQVVTLDSNKNAIWIQGLPQELGKVRELIDLLDKSENASTQAAAVTFTPLVMNYITAEQMNSVLAGIGMPGGIIIESNPKTLWVHGSSSSIDQMNEIAKKVDIAENTHSENILLTEIKLNHLTGKEMADILKQLDITVRIITSERMIKTLWFTGDDESVKLASTIAKDMDVPENARNNLFFVYKLTNITAKDAVARFAYLEMKEVKTFTYDFPQFSKSIMVFCPLDLKDTVISNLRQLDSMTEKIKVPIDYSKEPNGAYQLQVRRDLIVNLTGLPASSFTISGNVSRDDKPHFIMYLEETSETIKKVKDLIKFIDDPHKEGSE